MLRKYRISRTLSLAAIFLGMLIGLALVRVNPAYLFSWYGLLCFVFLLVLSRKLRKFPLFLALFAGLLIGYMRGQQFMRRSDELVALQGKTITAVVQVTGDGVYGEHSQLTFDGDHIQLESPYESSLPGSIQVAGFGEVALYKGDLVEVEGKVKLSHGSKQLRMGFADLRVVGRSNARIDVLRRKFGAGMQSALPEPHASFAMGILIGQKTTLPEDFMLMLSMVGLTHIIAVSGYNLTIIVDANRKLLQKGSKFQIMVGSTLLILSFVVMTGLSASIVRAAIVSLLSLAAWYYGRQFKPLLLIVGTAAVTALWNPFYIWSDIGWYLSFLAFFGVMIMGPLVNQRLFKTDSPASLKALFTESVCAMVMTIPFTMYIFKQVSLIALVANLLVVPFVPLAMLLALIAGMTGMLFPAVSGWVAWPAKVLLTYMMDIVTMMSRIPHILVQRQLSVSGLVVLYGIILLVLIILWKKQSKNATITEIKRSTYVERT